MSGLRDDHDDDDSSSVDDLLLHRSHSKRSRKTVSRRMDTNDDSGIEDSDIIDSDDARGKVKITRKSNDKKAIKISTITQRKRGSNLKSKSKSKKVASKVK